MFSRKRAVRWRPARLVELLDIGSYLLVLAALAPVILGRFDFDDEQRVLLTVACLAGALWGVWLEARRERARLRKLTWSPPVVDDAALMSRASVLRRRLALLLFAGIVVGPLLLFTSEASAGGIGALLLIALVAAASGARRWRGQVRWEETNNAELYVPARRYTSFWQYGISRGGSEV